MQATAPSRIVRITGASIAIAMLETCIDIRAFPSKDISRCPAIRFAVNRTHSVIGRIRFLVISISTIKFISGMGVPCGRRCDSMCFVFFVHPNIIIASQIVRESGKVIGRWAVVAKFCGYSATRFISRIDINIRIRILSVPFDGLPREYLISFLNLSITTFWIVVGVLDFFQFLFIRNTIGTSKVIHRRENVLDDGSKIENKLVIIFTRCFFLIVVLFVSNSRFPLCVLDFS